MRVLITGGTGFIGRALSHALLARGDHPVVLTRGKACVLPHACGACGTGGSAELVTWTPDRPGDWQSAVDGVDAVVHLAGASIAGGRWTDARMREIRESRVTPTRLLAEAIARAKAPPRVFVSGSAVGFYGTSAGDRVLTEEAPPGDDFLARVCVEWEAAAQPARDAGVRVCHPRFGPVLGREGGMLAALRPLFLAFAGGPVGDGAQFVPWLHLSDAVAILEAMIVRDDLRGAYNATAPAPVTMNDFAKELGASLARPAVLRAPEVAVRLALGRGADTVLRGQRAIPKRLTDAGHAFLFPDLASALEDLAG